jgi:hypothetical protein
MIIVENEGGEKLNNTTAATDDRLLKAGRMAGVAKVPSAMGEFVADYVYGKAVGEKVGELKQKCVEAFTHVLESPDPLPTTRDGLDLYTWASVLTKNGERLKVQSEQTKVGRVVAARIARSDLYSMNGTGEFGDKKMSWDTATANACWITDLHHAQRDPKTCKGPGKRDILEYALKRFQNGEALPDDYPQAIAEIVKAREEKNTAMRGSSSGSPSVLQSLGGPLPAKVPAHQALTSGSTTSQSPAKTATKTSLPDSVRERLERLKKTVGVKTLNSLFGQFPSQDRAKSVE